MPVPEAPMNEHYTPMARQYDVRLAGQVFTMQPETIPHAMD
jgi:hypothetical protein